MNTLARTRLLDRTWGQLRFAWRQVSKRDGHAFVQLKADLPEDDLPLLRKQIQRCLNSRRGKVSARTATAALGRAYLELNSTGRARFLRVLAGDFDVNTVQLEKVINTWSEATDESQRHAKIYELDEALQAPRLQILTQFNELPEGVKFLVDMRAELIRLIDGDAALSALERDLKQLLISWFDIGFLKLQQITWESPAAMLEKLIAYEAVHEIRSWDDLKNRLASDRRCYAFEHPHMPGEPLIFVEVALTNGLAANIQTLLDESAPLQDLALADTAIFYSISNAQQGLAGISFGDFLIKRVVAKLSHEFASLKHFATLSPLVNFRRWLHQHLENNEPNLLTPAEQNRLTKLNIKQGAETSLKHLLAQPEWPQDAPLCEALKPILIRLAARYLCLEKINEQRALDPVAHFHLTNGARIEQLNWMADRSQKGMRQSYGLMVNYLYQIGRIEANSAAYAERGVATTAGAVKTLLKS